MPAAGVDTLVICNPCAGGFRFHPPSYERLLPWLAQPGGKVRVEETRYAGHAEILARQAVEEGFQRVIAWGGDGTIHEVANGLAGSSVSLAVLPAGTANVLARELAIPQRLERALPRLQRAQPRRIALGQAIFADRTRYFVCVGGAGLDGSLIYHTRPQQKRRLGRLAYWLQAAEHFLCYRFPLFRVSANGHRAEATLVVAGRTRRFGGPFVLTPDAGLLREDFAIALFRTRSRLRYAALCARALTIGLDGSPVVTHWRSRSVRCEPLGAEPVRVELDGEAAGVLPVEFRIVPEALTLDIPPA